MLLHASHACASLGSSGRPKPGVLPAAAAEPHFELVHIPKNAGTELEEAGLAAGFRWGAYKWEGLCDGGWCIMSSRRGSVKIKVESTEKSPRGTVFSSFSFSDVPVNILTGAGYDPVTDTAELKVCPVKLEPA